MASGLPLLGFLADFVKSSVATSEKQTRFHFSFLQIVSKCVCVCVPSALTSTGCSAVAPRISACSFESAS